MNYKLIMLPNPILVNDERISEGDWMLSHAKTICQAANSTLVNLPSFNGIECYKIIAGIEGLPKLDLSAIAEEIGWVDVEKLADKFFESWSLGDRKQSSYELFRKVYEFSQSLNEKKFSEEDARQLIKRAILYAARFGEDALNHEEDILHSIKPKEYNVQYIQEGNTIKVTKIL